MICGESYVLLNAALCACALLLGGKLAGLSAPGRARLLAAAALGGGSALGALWGFGYWALLCQPLCVWLCFGDRGSQAVVRCVVTAFGAAMLLGGAMQALFLSGAAPLFALLASIALSGLVYLLASVLPSALAQVRQVELRVGENSVLLPAMLDSGNLLRDPITAAPVLVVPPRAMRALFPDMEELYPLYELPPGFRLLSVRTAAGGGLLPLFRPDLCRLHLNGHAVDAELLVAVAGREYAGVQALVPLSALPERVCR